MKNYILSIALLNSISAFAQGTGVNANMEVSANIDAGCFLTADNINFGTLMVPIIDTTSQSQAQIKCSKDASYSISVHYDNNVSSSSNSSNYSVTVTKEYGDGRGYILYNNKVSVTPSGEAFACTDNNTIVIRTKEVASLLGYEDVYDYDKQPYLPDTKGICSGRSVNLTTLNSLGSNTKGVLNGQLSNDNITFYLEIPNSSHIWNTNNKFASKANGIDQIIPLKAVIKRADNATHRLTPDTYTSSLTLSLNY